MTVGEVLKRVNGNELVAWRAYSRVIADSASSAGAGRNEQGSGGGAPGRYAKGSYQSGKLTDPKDMEAAIRMVAMLQGGARKVN
jgi:hypothetical protein